MNSASVSQSISVEKRVSDAEQEQFLSFGSQRVRSAGTSRSKENGVVSRSKLEPIRGGNTPELDQVALAEI